MCDGSDMERYVRSQLEEWYDMFPGGYVGDGVRVEDLEGEFRDEWNAMSDEAKRRAMKNREE